MQEEKETLEQLMYLFNSTTTTTTKSTIKVCYKFKRNVVILIVFPSCIVKKKEF